MFLQDELNQAYQLSEDGSERSINKKMDAIDSATEKLNDIQNYKNRSSSVIV